MTKPGITKNPFNIIVIVAALGYFVDIYDLILFGIVMKPSLSDIGIPAEQIFDIGGRLLGIQMIGMLVGGIVWGVMGDKLGRLSTLFFTIILYSLANIANGFVQTITQYEWMRFIAGFGLAGELGIGITLVSEVMTKESRGLGTSIVSGIGIAGAVLGYIITQLFDWRITYFAGGGLGLALLILRISVYESGMFHKIKEEKVRRGDFFSLFSIWKYFILPFKERDNIKIASSLLRFKKYIACIFIAIPVWYVISQLAVQSEKYANDALHISGQIIGGKAVMLHYIGASIGSLILGFISEKLRSRKKALFLVMGLLTVFITLYFLGLGMTATLYYILITIIGFCMGGLWAVFMVNASEQFGTNIRATVTTTAPNFVRGSTPLIQLAIGSLKTNYDLWTAGVIVGTICILLSFLAIIGTKETYGKNLDYAEEI